MAAFESFHGIVTAIDDYWTNAQGPTGCFKLMAVRDRSGSPVNFVISPDTYFVDNAVIRVRDGITGFHDPNVPVPMIYPPSTGRWSLPETRGARPSQWIILMPV